MTTTGCTEATAACGYHWRTGRMSAHSCAVAEVLDHDTHHCRCGYSVTDPRAELVREAQEGMHAALDIASRYELRLRDARREVTRLRAELRAAETERVREWLEAAGWGGLYLNTWPPNKPFAIATGYER